MLGSLVRVRLGEPWPHRSVRSRTQDCQSCNMGSNPIEAATNNKEIMKYDRFNLEEEIQNVWQTKDDLNAIAERHYDDSDGPMSADELSNVLIGLSELHETRMKKLWRVFETMVQQKNSFLTEEVTMGDVLDKIVDDAEKE